MVASIDIESGIGNDTLSGKYMYISRTTFTDNGDLPDHGSITRDGESGQWTSMPWPLCYYADDSTLAAGAGLRDNTLSTFDGVGAANAYATNRDATTDIEYLTFLYNPNEVIGLIEKFGPYEYLEGYNIEAITHAGGDAYNPDLEMSSTSFVKDRTSRARVYDWYKYHTSRVISVYSEAEDWYTDAPSEAMLNLRSTDFTFHKIKTPAYDSSDLYTLEDEAIATTSRNDSGTTGGGTGGMGGY